MLVYVTTPKIINQAFLDWVEHTGEEQRKIVHRVFQEFMDSPQASGFHSSSGLICFDYPQWQSMFDQWRDLEIRNHPEHQEKIRYYTDKLCMHLQSDWAVQHKLVMKEHLDEMADIVQQSHQDLFDELVRS